jgi:hypothetical protein
LRPGQVRHLRRAGVALGAVLVHRRAADSVVGGTIELGRYLGIRSGTQVRLCFTTLVSASTALTQGCIAEFQDLGESAASRPSPFSWAQYGAFAVPAIGNRLDLRVRVRWLRCGRSPGPNFRELPGAARPGPTVSLSGQKSLHRGRQSEQDARFIRITAFVAAVSRLNSRLWRVTPTYEPKLSKISETRRRTPGRDHRTLTKAAKHARSSRAAYHEPAANLCTATGGATTTPSQKYRTCTGSNAAPQLDQQGFGDADRDELLVVGSGSPFSASLARTAASQARASMDKVMWAYQPRHVRT